MTAPSAGGCFTPLGDLITLRDDDTRSISAENPEGRKGSGGQEKGGRKGRPNIQIPDGETAVIADIEGCGIINSMWFTCQDRSARGPYVLTNLILRIYWDGEETPSVETPLGDFFANGWGIKTLVNSLPVCVNPGGGFNCFWQMPFARSCRITVENQDGTDATLFYQINYSLVDSLPPNTAYFHAQYRRENPTQPLKDYTILDGVKGAGHYVGTFLAIAPLQGGWYGEGEVKIYIDGDTDFPTYCGTGTEDYFGGAWGLGMVYLTPFMGHPLHLEQEGQIPRYSCYRWHIMDPFRFKQDLRVTIQQIGYSSEDGFFERSDDISSVAYWYQTEPHAAFPALPDRLGRKPR